MSANSWAMTMCKNVKSNHFSISPLTPPLSLPGSAPSEVRGTRSEFGNPSPMYASGVKAIWKYNIDRSANLQRGIVTLSVTPPADAPVGKYSLSAKTLSEKTTLGSLVVLFNPWCSGRWRYCSPDKTNKKSVTFCNWCEALAFRGLHGSTENLKGSCFIATGLKSVCHYV